jgi:PAS domain S-box-containing protein
LNLNPAAHRVLVSSVSDLVGQPAMRVIADWPRLVEQIGDREEGCGEFSLGQGESRRCFQVHLSSLCDQIGRPAGRLVVMRDLQIHQPVSEERFRTIYDTAPVSIWQEDWTDVIAAIETLRAQGVTDWTAYFHNHPELVADLLRAVKILDVNQWTVTMFEARDKADLLASLDVVFGTEDTLPGFVAELTALASGQQVFFAEMDVNTVQGNTRHILMSMSFPPRGSAQGDVLVSRIDLTEQKRSQDELRRNREWLRVTLTSIGDAVIASDADGHITFMNPMAESLTGWTIAQALGQPACRVFNLVDERTGQPGEDLCARVLSEQRSLCLANNVALLARDGRQIPIEDSAALILDAGGAISGVVLVFHDVADKRRAQQAVRESERRLKRAQEIAHLGSWELDLITNRLTWSDEVYRIFGLVPQEFDATYEAFLEQVHPDDRVAVDDAYSGSLREGRDTYEIEHRIVRRDSGETRIVHEKCEHVRDASGRIVRSIGMVHDITERKQDEELLEQRVRERTRELQASEERFRQLAENIHEVFWILEPRPWRILYISPAYQAIWGRPEQELYERPQCFLDTIHPDDREQFWHDLATKWLGYDGEFRILRPDGALRWIRLRLFPVYNDEGQVYRLAGIATDLTEQKAAEVALLQAERLTVAGKMAASLAHEINNPLQAVIGCLGLARGAVENDRDPGKYLKLAHQEVRRTARIVAQLRSLGRPAQDMHKEPTDLNHLLGDVLLLNKKYLEGQKIAVIWQPDEGLSPLDLVRDSMHQVLLNLVLNAAEAMPEGGQLHLSTARTASPAGARVVVADSGGGIPADVLPHIFDAFYSTKDEGMGVGLFVSQGIVQQHSGRIEVESTPGIGTTFIVWLPA